MSHRIISYIAMGVSASLVIADIIMSIVIENSVVLALAWANSIIWIGVSTYLNILLFHEREINRKMSTVLLNIMEEKIDERFQESKLQR